MPAITEQLFNILQTVQRPGTFYATGKCEVFPPHLEVEGVGRIALPLLGAQAEQLVAVAEVAPYGLGADTIVDTKVRRTWQIDAKRVTLSGKHWQGDLNEMINRAAIGLGVADGVRAELYKLLVYDAGGFFIGHRDTEKAAGMFGTMVVVLPSSYSGGELVVKHQQQQVKLDLHCDDPSEIAFAAFYADCVHEVLPVTQGCRLTLIYNLLRTDAKKPLPKPPDYHLEQDAIAGLLREWTSGLSADTSQKLPEKLIYLLEHAYTSAELGFATLKGADSAVADAVLAASRQAGCEVHLALVSVEESGSAEYAGNSRYWNEENFEVGEVFERIETVSEWRRPDGKPSQLPSLPFNVREFCPPDALEQIEPDDVQFHEATGNEGVSFESAYRCAALVIWPQSHYLAIINQAGLEATLPVLRDFCRRLETEGQAQDSSLWREAHTLAGYVLRDWIPQYLGRRHNNQGLHDFLKYLQRLRDSENLRRFWTLLAEKGFYDKEHSTVLAQAVALLPWSEVVGWLEQAINKSAAQAQEACAALLACICAKNPDTAHDLRVAAHALFLALPGDPARFAHLQPWEHSRMTASSDLAADVLTGFSAIDPALAQDTLNYMLAWPTHYAMDAILTPAALRLSETGTSRDLAVVERLRRAVRMHLHTRVAKALAPPADWRRDSRINCTCQDCAKLRDFLDNPAQANWSFKAAEAKRNHVERSIKQHQSDLDCVTDRNSRPYALVCTKTQAGYLRRVEQRKNDLEILARLNTTKPEHQA
ncbi:MAG: 2OG-Fe(II) oxygenase [Sulfuricellaceae bacterium]